VGRTGRIPRVGLFVDAQNTGGWGLRPDLQRLREEAARLGSKPGVLEVAVVATAIRPAENGRCPAVSLGYRVEERWTVLRESTGEIKARLRPGRGDPAPPAEPGGPGDLRLRFHPGRSAAKAANGDRSRRPEEGSLPWELFIAAHYAYGLTELGLALAPADAA
jgi:hypothetical protein